MAIMFRSILFNEKRKKNIDIKVVNDFGREWNKFNYDSIEGSEELRIIFNDYFSLFPWEILKDDSCGFDLGAVLEGGLFLPLKR